MANFNEHIGVIISEEDKDIFQECRLFETNKTYKEQQQKELLDIFGINLENLYN